MIFINPIGGLASQLHKYFVALALAEKHNTDVKFYIDPNRLSKDRAFELEKFNIDIKYANKLEIFYFKKIKRRLDKLKLKLKLIDKPITCQGLMTYEYFHLVNDNTLIDREWVLGDIYFKHMYKELVTKFSLKNIMSKEAQKVEKLISSTNAISIHFRRGDYLNTGTAEFHGNLQLDYYINALKIIEQRIDTPVLFIFSDDIQWVKSNFTTSHKTYYIYISSHEDIILMSKCQHNIIANSGYSFLASYFNSNPDKIIVAPKQWIVNNEINDQITLHTDTSKWIRL